MGVTVDLVMFFIYLCVTCELRMGMVRNGIWSQGNDTGISHNIGNGNGKAWEQIAWEGKEWDSGNPFSAY